MVLSIYYLAYAVGILCFLFALYPITILVVGKVGVGADTVVLFAPIILFLGYGVRDLYKTANSKFGIVRNENIAKLASMMSAKGYRESPPSSSDNTLNYALSRKVSDAFLLRIFDLYDWGDPGSFELVFRQRNALWKQAYDRSPSETHRRYINVLLFYTFAIGDEAEFKDLSAELKQLNPGMEVEEAMADGYFEYSGSQVDLMEENKAVFRDRLLEDKQRYLKVRNFLWKHELLEAGAKYDSDQSYRFVRLANAGFSPDQLQFNMLMDIASTNRWPEKAIEEVKKYIKVVSD